MKRELLELNLFFRILLYIILGGLAAYIILKKVAPSMLA
jgi:hypothetical protein